MRFVYLWGIKLVMEKSETTNNHLMRLTASDFHTYFCPSKCDLRVYLRYQGVEESEPGPYEQVIRLLGMRHEKAHLATFPDVVDLSTASREKRESLTKSLIADNAPVIYQPVLRTETVLNGTACEIWGEPDYLILHKPGEYIMRDSKMSRQITKEKHPEILLQLQLYGWLYQQVFKKPPIRLEVHNGRNEIVEVLNDGGVAALAKLTDIMTIRLGQGELYSPVGWSKCGACGFHDRCWDIAEQNQDVAMIAGVDQALARALHAQGIKTIDALLNNFDEDSLSQFSKIMGNKTQRVGKQAAKILLMAKAMSTGAEEWMDVPQIPKHSNYVMFDLEGIPPQLESNDKIYLWGMQVFGEKPGQFLAAVAGFGEAGDKEGWHDFLGKAKSIFDEYGDIPFIHWHHYEPTHIKDYIKRFGDVENIAARVLDNLIDILPIAKNCVALPVPSYSLKVLEKYVGYKRTQTEYGGNWSIAKYIEATETENEQLRAELMDQILTYNREDLEATWAVFDWLRKMGKY